MGAQFSTAIVINRSLHLNSIGSDSLVKLLILDFKFFSFGFNFVMQWSIGLSNDSKGCCYI